MLGFPGASRYAHPAYAGGFALECAAMRRTDRREKTHDLRQCFIVLATYG